MYIDGTYLDHLKQPPELTLEGGKLKGRVSKDTGETFKIDFED